MLWRVQSGQVSTNYFVYQLLKPVFAISMNSDVKADLYSDFSYFLSADTFIDVLIN